MLLLAVLPTIDTMFSDGGVEHLFFFFFYEKKYSVILHVSLWHLATRSGAVIKCFISYFFLENREDWNQWKDSKHFVLSGLLQLGYALSPAKQWQRMLIEQEVGEIFWQLHECKGRLCLYFLQRGIIWYGYLVRCRPSERTIHDI